MPLSSTIIFFTSRASRAVGAMCILMAFIAAAVQLLRGPDSSLLTTPNLISTVFPFVILYLLPGSILYIAGVAIKSGRIWAAAIILIISVLSLFKLVFLLSKLPGPFFHPPLICELIARLACVMLSVPCALAWEDIVEMNRTRSRRHGYGPLSEQFFPPSARSYPPVPPPPAMAPRKPVHPEDPPGSQTPWS